MSRAHKTPKYTWLTHRKLSGQRIMYLVPAEDVAEDDSSSSAGMIEVRSPTRIEAVYYANAGAQDRVFRGLLAAKQWLWQKVKGETS